MSIIDQYNASFSVLTLDITKEEKDVFNEWFMELGFLKLDKKIGLSESLRI